MSFIGNSANIGEAISLKEGAVINLKDNVHMIFKENIADTCGGVIYVEDASFWTKSRIKCFLNVSNNKGCYNIEFENSTAGRAGAALFGGWVDVCGREHDVNFSKLLKFKADNSVGSNPTRVCMCTNSTLRKYKAELHIEVFPG